MSLKRGKILVIRGGAIGDFVLTLPAIAALRRQFPDAHLEVLGYPHIVQLALAAGLVDRVQSIEARALAGFFARGGSLEKELADYFCGFNVVVSYLYDPDDIFRTNFALCSRAQFIAGPHRPNEAEQLHATKVYLKPLERLAIFDADFVPKLNLQNPSDATRQIALHPGSGSEKKNWPETHWAELLQRLIDSTKWNVLLMGGEAEGDRLERLGNALPSERVQIARSVALVDLAHQLQRCAAFVGHDSGISHLAAALGLPGLVLWGDSREDLWRPPHDRVVILRGGTGLRGMTVDQVMQELVRLMERGA